jgi:quinol monooxygenase YgiN
MTSGGNMYGMQGKLFAKPGKRDEFIQILLRAAELVGQMPECHLYAVSKDLTDESAIVVMEIWNDKAAHDASLQNEDVRALIGEAMPLMSGQPEGNEFEIVGGHGLNSN